MSTNIQTEARRVVDELVAAGAAISYRTAVGSFPPSFTYEMQPNGDRRRCRTIITDSKFRPALWSAILAEIATRLEAHDG